MSAKRELPKARPPGVLHQHGPTSVRPWPLRVGFWLFLGIAAFYLLTEHRAHLVAGLYWLPFLLLAACPLMHVLGHGGHGGHGGHRGHDRHGGNKDDAANPSPPQTTSPDAAAPAPASRPYTHGGDMP